MKIKKIFSLFLLLNLSIYAETPMVSMTPATTVQPATTMTPMATSATTGEGGKTDDIYVTEDASNVVNVTEGKERPQLPLEPAIKTGGVLEVTKQQGESVKFLKNEAWKIVKNITVLVDEKVEIFKPLEITNNLDVAIVVVDDEVVKAPFEIEFNESPELGKEFFYKIKYVDSEAYNANKEQAIDNAQHWISLDLDEDKRPDTLIYSESPFIQGANSDTTQKSKKRDNYIEVDGARISNNGIYKKQIYMVVDTNM